MIGILTMRTIALLAHASPLRRSGAWVGVAGRASLLSYNSLVRFTWDARKATANLRKHGVSFEEAETAFGDKLGAYYPDALHESRFILLGYSRRHRLLYVVHAEVAADSIRIISARKATKDEKRHYEDD
jgi:uncharacterized DUF497 family protein